jgi:hypothetical protein
VPQPASETIAEVGMQRARYTMYGLTVESDIQLPTLGNNALPHGRSDVVFRRIVSHVAPEIPADAALIAELRCHAVCHAGSIYSRVYRSNGATWVVNPGVATCYLNPTGDRVEVFPDPTAGERALGLLLAGQVSTLLLQHRGRICLHASAVLTDTGVVGFTGGQGQGKSTMAASFLQRGAALVTDDILTLLRNADRVEAAPGLPMMKLWQQSVRGTLQLDHELPNVRPEIDKKLLSLDGRYSHAPGPALLRAIYVLERYEAGSMSTTSSRPLLGRELMGTLLNNTSHYEFLLPADIGRLLGAYAHLARLVSIKVLRYPNGFDYQDAVWEFVQSELRGAAGC